MKAIRITQKGSLEHMMKKEDINDCDFNDILDLVSFNVDNEITAIYISNHFSNLQIKNNRTKPLDWIFSNIDIEEDEEIFTLDEALKMWG